MSCSHSKATTLTTNNDVSLSQKLDTRAPMRSRWLSQLHEHNAQLPTLMLSSGPENTIPDYNVFAVRARTSKPPSMNQGCRRDVLFPSQSWYM
jgi:hypothetical protein